MADIKATSAITIVDMSDGKQLSVYISSNQARIQIKDVNANTWTPDWSVGAGNVVLTPSVYVNQSAVALTGAGAVVTWERRAGSGSVGALEANETVTNGVLTVNANKLSTAAGGLLTYIVTVTYTDPDTALVSVAKNEISFALVTTGENAKSAWISGEQAFKYAAGAGSPTPASITLTANLQNVSMTKWQYKNGAGWSDFAPAETGTTIAIAPNSAAFLGGATATIRIVTSDANVGDTTSIYKVTDGTSGTSSSIAYLTNESVVFPANVSGQVAATTVNSAVVAYTGTSKVTPTLGTISGMPTGMTVTPGSVVNNEIPLTIAITANSTLGGAGPLSGEVLIPITAPVSTTLRLSWAKVNTGATGSTGGTGATGAPAKTADIAVTNQVFKSEDGGTTYTPASIVMTPTFQTVTYSKWQYSINGGSTFVDAASGSNGITIAGNVLTLANNSALFTASVTSIPFRVITSDAAVHDTVTISRVSSGLGGLTAILSNEAHVFAANNAGTVSSYAGSGTTIRLFEGGTELTYDGAGTSNGTWKIVATPTGITTGTITDSGLFVTIGDHSAMGGDTASISYAITGKRTTGGAISLVAIQTFAKAKMGAVGADAIVFSVFAPSGSVFINQQGNLTLDCVMYKGSTAVTPSYSWRKYAGGNWNTVVGTTKSVSIAGSSVSGTGQFKCIATYNSVAYEDFITLEDKTDNYQSTIDSTAGNVFKNTVGSTVLICRVFQNGLEVDAAKNTSWGPSTSERPATPATGDFYYQYANTAPTTASRPTTVWRWSGSAWVDVTADATYKHTLTYKWYRRNASGVPESGDGGGTGLLATGKLIYVDGSMVTDKAVITCEVE